MRHVAGVLGGMRVPLEQQIASVALGRNGDKADLKVRLYDHVPSLPPGVVVGDLRAAARDEAARLERARALARGARHAPSDGRPSVTVCSRPARFENCWVYRLIFETPDGQLVWETVTGIRDELRTAPRRSRELGQWLEAFERLVEPVLSSVSQALLSSLSATLHASLSLAIRRETAIVAELEHQRARLASALLQPGLFDRRAERAAATRDATLDEALARCTRRMAELASGSRISLDRPRLILGAIGR
jgi:hypothetical protein